MKPANLAAQLAAVETELACLKMALTQVKEDREELRQERDDWRRETEMLAAYDRAQMIERRRVVMQQWANWLSGPATADVIPLAGRWG